MFSESGRDQELDVKVIMPGDPIVSLDSSADTPALALVVSAVNSKHLIIPFPIPFVSVIAQEHTKPQHTDYA